MASPWPPRGDGEAPHGDGEFFVFFPTPFAHFKHSIMSGDRLPSAWEVKVDRFE